MDAAGVDASKYQGSKQKRLLRRAFKDAREGRRRDGFGPARGEIGQPGRLSTDEPPGVGM